jgi:hypothetical protein
VSGSAKGAHDREVQVLVGQEAHGCALHRAWKYDDLVRDRVGGVAQRGRDVVVRQSRVRVEDVDDLISATAKWHRRCRSSSYREDPMLGCK